MEIVESPHEEVPAAPTPKRSRFAIALVLLLVLVGSTAGVVAAVRGIVDSRNGEPRYGMYQVLNDGERARIGASSDAEVLWSPGAASAFGRFLESEVPGNPTEFLEVTMFGDYAFAIARDPVDRTQVVQGEWRGDEVYLFRSLALLAGAEPATFDQADVPWGRLDGLMNDAEDLLEVEEPEIRYLQITAEASAANGMVIQVFITSQNDEGGVVIADGLGAVTQVVKGAGLP